MSKYTLTDDYGHHIADFNTRAGAYDYINNNGYADQPYSLKDNETGMVTVSLVLPEEEKKRISKAAELIGLTEEEFITKCLNDFLAEEETEKQVEPKTGQIWKYKGSENLYIIGTYDIASCAYYTCIDLQDGSAGPIWENTKQMVEAMEFVTESIHDILIPPFNSGDEDG